MMSKALVDVSDPLPPLGGTGSASGSGPARPQPPGVSSNGLAGF